MILSLFWWFPAMPEPKRPKEFWLYFRLRLFDNEHACGSFLLQKFG
jgi:hypothetical protein